MARPIAFAIKANLGSLPVLAAQKTMYGGKQIAAGDTIFLFAGANEARIGLIGRGRVVAASAVARLPGIDRQTPRVDVEIADVEPTRRPLSRADLRGFDDWDDGRPETELNFKFYRQATDKIVGLSEATGDFLDSFF